jgi:hypothetical protein
MQTHQRPQVSIHLREQCLKFNGMLLRYGHQSSEFSHSDLQNCCYASSDTPPIVGPGLANRPCLTGFYVLRLCPIAGEDAVDDSPATEVLPEALRLYTYIMPLEERSVRNLDCRDGIKIEGHATIEIGENMGGGLAAVVAYGVQQFFLHRLAPCRFLLYCPVDTGLPLANVVGRNPSFCLINFSADGIERLEDIISAEIHSLSHYLPVLLR